ncbi:MAG: adenylyl-sulfate kinase [Thermodesulfobacteriota bacterium]
MDISFCVWFTGLPAAGKSTLAGLLKKALIDRGFEVALLDGEQARRKLSPDLGFSRADRMIHLNRLADEARKLIEAGNTVLVAAIAPYEASRAAARARIGEYIEVFINCPLEVCLGRDPKGLYDRARKGEIKKFTGLDDPYETPLRPDIEVRTAEESPEESLARIIKALEMMGRLPAPPAPGYTEEEERLVKERLRDLGYM